MASKTIILSSINLSDQIGFFHRMAAKQKAENKGTERSPDIDFHFKDDQGRTCITHDSLDDFHEKENREKAVKEHGNDKNKRLDLCNFPKRDRSFMFNYDYMSVLSNFTGLDLKKSDWLFIYGGVGTGKTTLAMRLVWEWMKPEPARKATFLSVRDWMEEQHKKLDFDNENKSQYPELPSFRKYVILDDFDKIGFTEWQMLQVFRLIDFLDRNDKKTIITSNRGFSELFKKAKHNLDYQATLDRIAGRTKKSVLSMKGKSFRNSNYQF